jgi:hypothetical protein
LIEHIDRRRNAWERRRIEFGDAAEFTVASILGEYDDLIALIQELPNDEKKRGQRRRIRRGRKTRLDRRDGRAERPCY